MVVLESITFLKNCCFYSQLPSLCIIFQLGVDFDEKTADMRDVKTRGVFEAGKLVLVEKVCFLLNDHLHYCCHHLYL